jgi:Protein of unknown function (DUF1761)
MWWDNILTIIVAAATGFMVGGIWYGPLFGKAWMAELGFTEEELAKGNMAQIYGTTFALSLFAAFFLGHVMTFFPNDLKSMVMNSTGIALAFIVPAIGTNYLFSKRSLKLFFIDAGYWTVFYAAMGTVFGLMG